MVYYGMFKHIKITQSSYCSNYIFNLNLCSLSYTQTYFIYIHMSFKIVKNKRGVGQNESSSIIDIKLVLST